MADENAMQEEADEAAAAPDATEDSSTSESAEASGERDTGENPSSDGDDKGEDSKAPRRRDRLDKRFGELTGEIHSLRGQLESKDREMERMLRILERGGTTTQAAGDEGADSEPSRDNFDDFQDYLDERAKWVARQEFREHASKHEAAQAKRDAQARAAETEARWQKSHTAALEKHGDEYAELFEVVGRSIDDDLANEIKMADDPASLVLYLGKHPEALAKVRGMTVGRRSRELGRIEERLNSERSRSSAPKPPTPVRGGAGSADPLSDKVPTDQWIKNRQAQLAKQRSGR